MLAIPAEAIKASLLDFLREFWGTEHDAALALAQRPLRVKAEEVSSEIHKSAITIHPLYHILRYVLHDIADHCEAIDLIGKNRTTLLHVRHIEELYTVSKYLLATPDRYEEFAWRWDNFHTLHAIRNRILNLKQPLDQSMVEWLRVNLETMKRLFSSKFDCDPTICADQWEKLSNWLYKIPLNEIFEKAGRLASYTSTAYDWNSQAVHLSPLGGMYMGCELQHQDYGDFALDSACTYLHKMCHECSVIVSDQEALRKYYLRQVLLETYEMLCNRPGHYMELANKGGQYAKLTELLLKKPFDFTAVMSVSLSSPPKDPLVLDLKAGVVQ
jgi:hypothetical protein